jgi:hypothetical protein
MNNLTKYLISFALLCLSNVAISEDIEFSINCEILDQVILEAADGKSKRYSSIEGKEKVGDSYNVNFSFHNFTTEEYNLFVHYGIQSMGSFGEENMRSSSKLKNLIFQSKTGGRLHLSDDYFYLSNGVHYKGERYYKNDWSLLVTDSLGSRIMALNCMGVPAAYDQMLKKMRDFHKANPAKPK